VKALRSDIRQQSVQGRATLPAALTTAWLFVAIGSASPERHLRCRHRPSSGAVAAHLRPRRRSHAAGAPPRCLRRGFVL